MPGPQYTQAVANLLLSLFGQKSIPERQRAAYDQLKAQYGGSAGSMGGSGGMGGAGGMGGMFPALDPMATSFPGQALSMATEAVMNPPKVDPKIQHFRQALDAGIPAEQAALQILGRPLNDADILQLYGEKGLRQFTDLGTETTGYIGASREINDPQRPGSQILDEAAAREADATDLKGKQALAEIEAKGDVDQETDRLSRAADRIERDKAEAQDKVQWAVDRFDTYTEDTVIKINNDLYELTFDDTLDKVKEIYDSGWILGPTGWHFKGKLLKSGPTKDRDVVARIESVINSLALPLAKPTLGAQFTANELLMLKTTISPITGDQPISGEFAVSEIKRLKMFWEHYTNGMMTAAEAGGVDAGRIESAMSRMSQNR